MNSMEQKIYKALGHAMEEECRMLKDDEKFLETLDMDSISTAIFLLDMEQEFGLKIELEKFNREITFGELKKQLEK